ncbi:MAG: hypothetical protein AB8C95_05980 [Phycisphaeraceae bacterium]
MDSKLQLAGCLNTSDRESASRLFKPRLFSPASLVLVVAFAGCLVWFASFSYYGSFYRGWDAQLYYAHLRSAMLDYDLDCTNEIQSLTPGKQVFVVGKAWGGLPQTNDGSLVNIYTVGSSVVGVPGFVAGHVVALMTGHETDGYSRPYEFAVTLWYLLLVALGCGALCSAMSPWVGDRPAWFAVLALFLGTNLVYYTGVLPLMNHGPSFALMCFLIWLAMRLYQSPDRVLLWRAVSVVVFLLVLTRPTDAVMMIVLLPAALRVIKTGWRPSVSNGLPVVLAVFAAAGVQLLVWRAVFGRWVTNGYSEWADGAGFDFANPMMPEILISGQGGGWLYHPLFAIGTLGLLAACCFVRGRDRGVWIVLAAGVVFHIGLYSFWVSWDSGDSFGNRIFINSAPLVAFGLAYLIHLARRRAAVIACASVLGLLVLSNALLMAGFIQDVLPPRETADLPALLDIQWQLIQDPKMGGKP